MRQENATAGRGGLASRPLPDFTKPGDESMNAITLNDWIDQLKARFDERTLRYMTAHKAKIFLQLKDHETGELHLHQIEYVSKDAEHLTMEGNPK